MWMVHYSFQLLITAVLVDQIRNHRVPVLLFFFVGSLFISSLVVLLLSAAYCSSFHRADANSQSKASAQALSFVHGLKANLGLMSRGQ